MRVVFYPVGDKNRASSRYRVHWVVAAAKDFSIGNKTNWQKADVLVFQRALGSRHFDFAKQARAAKKLVIFDLSDFYFYRHRWKRQMGAIRKMAKLSHCMTTSNEDDATDIRTLFNKRAYVIPGAQKASKYHRKHSNVEVPTIVWLGRENTMLKTLDTVWPALERLTGEGVRFKLLLINDTGNTHGLRLRGQRGRYPILLPPLPANNIVVGQKWKLSEVYPTIAKCDVGICPQMKQPDGRYHKDENKAVTCWMCGVPCVTFNITKDWYGDLHKFLTDWQFRAGQGKKAIQRAGEWLPENVAKKWQKIIRREMERL